VVACSMLVDLPLTQCRNICFQPEFCELVANKICNYSNIDYSGHINIFDLSHNNSVTRIHLYQLVFFLCITKYRKMIFLSICHCMRFHEQAKRSKEFHSNAKCCKRLSYDMLKAL